MGVSRTKSVNESKVTSVSALSPQLRERHADIKANCQAKIMTFVRRQPVALSEANTDDSKGFGRCSFQLPL